MAWTPHKEDASRRLLLDAAASFCAARALTLLPRSYLPFLLRAKLWRRCCVATMS